MTQQESERATKPMGTMAKSVALVLFGAGVATVGPQMAAALSTLVPLPAFAFPGEAPAESSLQAQADAPAVPRNQIAIAPSVSSPNLIADIVREVGPSVVRIDASRTVRSNLPPQFQDPFFRQFFGNAFPMPPSEQIQQGWVRASSPRRMVKLLPMPTWLPGPTEYKLPSRMAAPLPGSDRSRFGDGHCGDQN